MEKHKRNTLSIVESMFVFIFAVLLAAPAFQHTFKVFRFEPLDENRQRASAPEMHELRELSTFKVKLEKYLLDSYGFRDELIRLKNEVDYRLFHTSDKVLIDPSGRLFPKYFLSYRREIAAATDEQWSEVFQKFKQLHDRLEQRNIQLLVVPIPLGDSIYPEQYTLLEETRFDDRYHQKFFKFFDQHNIHYVDVSQALKRHKDEPIYFHTDFHYTALGSFYVMREILNALYPLAGMGKVWDYPVEYRLVQHTDGVLSKYLGMYTKVTDDAPAVKQQWETCARKVDGGYETICPDNNLLPPTVIFGNSFIATMLENGFSDEFTQLKVHLIVDLAKEFDTIPEDTRIVIVEFYELNMWEFLYKDILPLLD